MPRRRPSWLVGAVTAGALVAAFPWSSGPPEPAPVETLSISLSTSELATGYQGDDRTTGDDGAGSARADLNAAETQERVEVLRQDRASRAAARRAAAAEAARPTFVLPTVGRLSSCFCERWGTMHWGIDIAAPMLTPIRAVADGIVVKAGAASGYGQVVELQHEDGTVTLYGHMETIEVAVGDVVRAGDLIAKVGSRGYSTGPHLHLEVYPDGLDGARTDPRAWLAARGVKV